MYSLPLTSHTCPPLPSAMITSWVTLPKPPPGSTPRAVSTSPRSSSLNVCAGIGRSLHGFAVALVLPWPAFCLGPRFAWGGALGASLEGQCPQRTLRALALCDNWVDP